MHKIKTTIIVIYPLSDYCHYNVQYQLLHNCIALYCICNYYYLLILKPLINHESLIRFYDYLIWEEICFAGKTVFMLEKPEPDENQQQKEEVARDQLEHRYSKISSSCSLLKPETINSSCLMSTISLIKSDLQASSAATSWYFTTTFPWNNSSIVFLLAITIIILRFDPVVVLVSSLRFN